MLSTMPFVPVVPSSARLVCVDGRPLPLRKVELTVDARGGLARTLLVQHFENPHAEPLAVTYTLPLPHDAAVSAFTFVVGEERIVGEVDRRAAARERFERALVEGRTAALLEQERGSVFTQEVGNVPPHATVRCELTLDQRLAWRGAEGSWEWRFPTVVAPRYHGSEGRVVDAAALTVDVADGPTRVDFALTLDVRDGLVGDGRVESPSHGVDVERRSGATRVRFSSPSPALDRDVVIRWRAATPEVGVRLSTSLGQEGTPLSSEAFGLLTLVPPSTRLALREVPRDLIVLLDTSGSMSGEPLAQAKAVTAALLSTLQERDSLELIEFSDKPRRYARGPERATAKNLRSALAWVEKLRASGGTEMREGILEALAPLNDEAQRQVVLVTDGCIGFEQEILSEVAHRLPPGSRVHVVGVGSAVNRSLTQPVARAGRGLELILGLGEDPERAAAALCARTASPQVVDLEVTGSALRQAALSRPPDLYAGAPVLLPLQLRPEGGELLLRGRTADGEYFERVSVPPVREPSSLALSKLFARECAEELELNRAIDGRSSAADAALEALGLKFQIPTRLTSWVAVSAATTVDPTAPTRKERMPQLMPHGMSLEGVGLSVAVAGPPGRPSLSRSRAAPAPMPKGAARVQAQARLDEGSLGSAGGGAAPPPKLSAPVSWDADESYDEEVSDAAPARQEAKKRKAEEAASPPYEPAPPPPAKAPPPARDEADDAATRTRAGVLKRLAVKGRLVLRQGTLWVVEWVVTRELAGLPWQPPATATLRLSDGSTRTVTVDLTRSTAALTMTEGLVMRVTLVVADESVGQARSLELPGLFSFTVQLGER